jgi:hypothetical protein
MKLYYHEWITFVNVRYVVRKLWTRLTMNYLFHYMTL